MRIKDEYVQPIVLALSVGLFEARILSDSLIWLFIGWSHGLYVPLIWLMGIIVVIQLIKKKQYKHCVIILCLNIFISSFYDGIFVFTHLGRKTNVYVPYSIQDAKEKGAFICEYKQVNEVVLLDSVELKVKEAFACQYCFYDDKDVIHTAPDMLPYFVACPMNQEQMKAFRKTFYIEQFGQRSSLHFIDDIWCPSIDIDTITGLPPNEIILRIRQDIKDTSGLCKEIYVDSICFVRMQEED